MYAYTNYTIYIRSIHIYTYKLYSIYIYIYGPYVTIKKNSVTLLHMALNFDGFCLSFRKVQMVTCDSEVLRIVGDKRGWLLQELGDVNVHLSRQKWCRCQQKKEATKLFPSWLVLVKFCCSFFLHFLFEFWDFFSCNLKRIVLHCGRFEGKIEEIRSSFLCKQKDLREKREPPISNRKNNSDSPQHHVL